MKPSLPTDVQRALLKASLLDGEEQLRADATFRALTNLDDLDAGSHRLLPLYYRRLTRDGRQDPDLGRLSGVHRKAWYENLFLRKRAEELLGHLEQRGISTMLLKGAGLHTSIYSAEPTLRPLDDVDVMVKASQVSEAIRAVQELGYVRMRHQLYKDEWPGLLHSCSYKRGYRESVDLHCRPLRFQRDPEFTRRAWDRSVEATLGSVATRTLDATDHLLVTISHGVMPNQVPTCRWVADAVLLAQKSPIDWDRLADDAVATWHPLLVKGGLEYLRDEFHVGIPASAFSLISKPQPRLWTLLDSISEHSESRWRRIVGALASDYLMAHYGESFWEIIKGYPRFFRLRNYRGLLGTLKRIFQIARSGSGAERTSVD